MWAIVAMPVLQALCLLNSPWLQASSWRRVAAGGSSPRMQLDAQDAAMEAAAVAAVVRQAQEEAVEEASQDELQLSNIDVDLALALGETSPSVIDAEADAVFEATDLDGDGTISFSELSYHMSAVGYSSTVISLAFGVLDTDLDGSVSPAELRNCFHRFESSALRIALGLAVGRQSSTLESPEEGDVRSALAEEMFSMLDEDGDGAISPAELRGHLMAKGYARSTVDEIFRALDLNADGQISPDELCTSFVRCEYSALRLALGVKALP